MTNILKSLNGVPLDNLLLDPNNPRFAEDFSFAKERIPDDEIESKQQEILDHFKGRETDDLSGIGDAVPEEGEVIEETQDYKYGLDSLIRSIRSIGFVPVDKLVVRKIEGFDKYLVVEGNRRTCSCKLILEKHVEGIARGKKPGDSGPGSNIYVLEDELIASIKNLDVLELDLEGVDQEERERRIRIILGVRHHGSLLPWEPLPSAYNIYRKYIEMEPRLEEFSWKNGRARDVMQIFALGKESPRKALRAYIAYKQLKEAGFVVKPRWFTLIQELICNAKLGRKYLEADKNTFELTEDALTKVDQLCQFHNRDELSPDSAENFKILRDSKSVKSLAKLVDAEKHADEGVRVLASGLLEKVESLEIPLEPMSKHPEQSAVDALTEYLNRLKWVDQLEKMLSKFDVEGSELKIEDFGSTNDRLKLENLDKQMEIFRRVFAIN